MPLITGCKIFVDEKSMAAAYSLDQAHRLALPYLDKQQSIKIEIQIESRPNQVWAYDYAIKSWVLQRQPVGNDREHRGGSLCRALSRRRQWRPGVFSSALNRIADSNTPNRS